MFLVFFCICLFFNFLKFYDTCPLEYRITDPNHSFCSQPFPDVVDQLVTLSDQEYIVDMHNYERHLTQGTNMEKMYWNDELAEIALNHARTCIFEHDKINQRSVPRIPLPTGQNIAMGYENWTEVIEGWIEEKEHYYHSFPSPNIFSHYTQMIWHSSVLIGCAATICPPFGPYNIPWRFYICNYIRGMLNSNYHAAYQQGLEEHPLHDCQGKVCLYNGTLDLNTCECQCSTYASGTQCEKLNCSILPSCRYYSSISCIAVDVPLECPGLCGLCDRYAILQHLYSDEDLAPNMPTTTPITTERSSIKTKSIFRELQTRTSTPIINTTVSMLILTKSSSTIHLPYHIILYLIIKYLLVAYSYSY